MVNFNYYVPTQVAFGRGTMEYLPELVRKYGGTKVLVHYGGNSALRSGIVQNVEGMLSEAGIPYVKLGGVVPNPRLSMVHQGIELCRMEGIDFLLAIGGGSVIDSCKAIGYGVCYDGEVWDIYTGVAKPKSCLPVGAILTIPAAGSEMSDSSVITNDDGDVKIGFSSDLCRCKFAIMDPTFTFTLPQWQTACGITDIMMHTMERYFSREDDMEITDSIAEALIRTCMTEGRKVLDNPENYEARANIMWAGSLAHNDLTGCGTTGDWATHMIEHELSGMFNISHGAGLAAVWGSWARYSREGNLPRFARFARNVMGLDTSGMSDLEAAEAGIRAMENFYRSIGMPTNIHDLLGRNVSDSEVEKMADMATHGGSTTLGALKILDREDIIAIYNNAK